MKIAFFIRSITALLLLGLSVKGQDSSIIFNQYCKVDTDLFTKQLTITGSKIITHIDSNGSFAISPHMELYNYCNCGIDISITMVIDGFVCVKASDNIIFLLEDKSTVELLGTQEFNCKGIYKVSMGYLTKSYAKNTRRVLNHLIVAVRFQNRNGHYDFKLTDEESKLLSMQLKCIDMHIGEKHRKQ